MQPRFFQSIRLRESIGKSFTNEKSTLDWRAKLLITCYEELSEEDQKRSAIFITRLHALAQSGSSIARHFLVTLVDKLPTCNKEMFDSIVSALQNLSDQHYYPEVVCALSIIHFTYPIDLCKEDEEVYSIRQGVSYLKRAAYDHSPETVSAAHQLVALYSECEPNSSTLFSFTHYYYRACGCEQIFSNTIPITRSIAMLEDYAHANCMLAIDRLIDIYSGHMFYSSVGATSIDGLKDEIKANEWAIRLLQAEKRQDELLSKYLINAIHVTLKYANSLSRRSDQYSLAELVMTYVRLHKMDGCQAAAFQHKIKTQLIAYANEGYAHSCMHLSDWYLAGANIYGIVKSSTQAAFWQKRAIENGICHDVLADVGIISHLVTSEDSQELLESENDLLLLAYKNGSRFAAINLAKQAFFQENNLPLTNKYIQFAFDGKISSLANNILHTIAVYDRLNQQSGKLGAYSIRWLGLAILKKNFNSLEFIETNLRKHNELDLLDKWQKFADECRWLTYPEVYHQEMNELVSETVEAFANTCKPVNANRRAF